MKYQQIKKHKGIGLIEVLITTLVVAVGLLAVASLQGNLMGTSGLNRARSEAMQLAQQKLEQLRDSIERGAETSTTAGEYNAITNGIDAEIVGANENFYRYWLVDNLPTTLAVNASLNCGGTVVTADTTGPRRKRVCVRVAWGATGTMIKNGTQDALVAKAIANNSPTVADEQVIVQSIVAFEDVSPSVMAAKKQTPSLSVNNPSTNAGSSDEIYDKTNVALVAGETGAVIECGSRCNAATGQVLKNNGDGTGSVVYYCPSPVSTTDIAVKLIPFENGLYTRRVHYLPEGGSFKEAIELFEPTGDGQTCRRVIRYNGGVIIPVKGTVYSRATSGNGAHAPLQDLNLFTFNATESGSYCFPKQFPNVTSANYTCYIGGNCKVSAAGITATTDGVNTTTAVAGDNTVVTQCPTYTTSTSTGYPNNVYSLVGPGGWRGKIGVLGIAPAGLNVCFAEELLGTPVSLDTARNYYTRRTSGSVLTNEGINKPQSCHNFLIVNGKSTASGVASECSTQAASITGLVLASKNIARDLSGTSANVFDTLANTASCGASLNYTITGPITGTDTDRANVVILLDGTLCNKTPNSGSASTQNTSYTCSITRVPPLTAVMTVTNGYASANTLALTTSPTTLTTATTPAAPSITAGTSAAASCTTHTGWTVASIAHGNSVTAYQTATVATGACISETQTCNNGTLISTNNYQFETCTPTTYNLIVNKTGTGTVSSNVSGINCGSTCTTATAAYVSGTTVILQATDISGSGYTFSSWSGCTRTTGSSCEVDIGGSDTTVTANFAALPTNTIQGTLGTTGTGAASIINTAVTGTGASCTVDSAASTYSCTVVSGWTGSLNAGGSCYGSTINGTARNFTNVTSNLTAQDFTLSCTAPMYQVTASSATNNWTVSNLKCNNGACTGLIPGTYTVSLTFSSSSGSQSCSKTTYTITNADINIVVTKGTGSGTPPCVMTP